jgi:UDP-GlcNAc:undecaprenyl-phosphate/decaprenyl-phosphate GlcNAc-1-phosphate transferase
MSTAVASLQTIFEALLISLVVTIGLTWISIRLAWRLQLVDIPRSEPHKLHDRAVPQAGGLALYAGLLLCSALFGLLHTPEIKAILIAALPVFFFGLRDDYKALRARVKLVGQLMSAVILLWMGVGIKIFESPEFFLHGTSAPYVLLDWLLTLLWVVGLTNAFNFVDSMDGLVAGLGAMSAAFFLLITLVSQQPGLAVFSALVVGVCIGLYFYNATPALLFLGDAGAQSLGFILAALAIASNPVADSQASSWFTPVLLLGVPIFDAMLVVISRFRRGRPLYSAARDHTFHRLVRQGIGPNRAVLVMQLAALILGCLAYLSLQQPPAIANALFAAILLIGGAGIIYMERPEKQ